MNTQHQVRKPFAEIVVGDRVVYRRHFGPPLIREISSIRHHKGATYYTHIGEDSPGEWQVDSTHKMNVVKDD